MIVVDCKVEFLCQADHSSREVLLSVCVCHCVLSGGTITLYTYNEQEEEARLRKRERKRINKRTKERKLPKGY